MEDLEYINFLIKMYVTKEKNCYCHTCNKRFHYLGITRHRMSHKEKKEDCKITFTHGDTYLYEFSKIKK